MFEGDQNGQWDCRIYHNNNNKSKGPFNVAPICKSEINKRYKIQ